MKRKILLVCALLLLLVQSADAMSSPAYRIDWFILQGGGGGPASSAGYQVNFTVGQTAIYSASSPSYKVQLGYWAGLDPFPYHISLPSVRK